MEEKRWSKRNRNRDISSYIRLSEAVRDYGPCTTGYGQIYYCSIENTDYFHREDGPAAANRTLVLINTKEMQSYSSYCKILYQWLRAREQ
jgi:hypothetical protein